MPPISCKTPDFWYSDDDDDDDMFDFDELLFLYEQRIDLLKQFPDDKRLIASLEYFERRIHKWMAFDKFELELHE